MPFLDIFKIDLSGIQLSLYFAVIIVEEISTLQSVPLLNIWNKICNRNFVATFTNKLKAVKYISKLCSKIKTFQLNLVLEHKRNGTNTIRISDIFIIKQFKNWDTWLPTEVRNEKMRIWSLVFRWVSLRKLQMRSHFIRKMRFFLNAN